jgi:hypothetical protein
MSSPNPDKAFSVPNKKKKEFPDKILSSHTFTTAPNKEKHETLRPSWYMKDVRVQVHVLSQFGQRGY